jgi:hypothetical protein
MEDRGDALNKQKEIAMTSWTRWFAWYPVRLQIEEKYAWLCYVEYEQVSVGSYTGALGSGPTTVTHYRMPDDSGVFRGR